MHLKKGEKNKEILENTCVGTNKSLNNKDKVSDI